MVHDAQRARVGVVIPCYNHGAYLDDAVNSVLAQTYADCEIVVVDDGSTDPATNARLQCYDKPRTRIISIPNGGLPAARNRGIAALQTEYILTLDADDRFAPTFVEKAIAMLDADSAVTALYEMRLQRDMQSSRLLLSSRIISKRVNALQNVIEVLLR